jgi:hypothetical protein
MRTALVWVIRQRVVARPTDVSVQPVGPTLQGQEFFLILEDGTDMLSQNVGKELPVLAA